MTQQDQKKQGITEILWNEKHNEFWEQVKERGKIFEDKYWETLKKALEINGKNQENIWAFHRIVLNYGYIEWNIPENEKISQAINRTFQNENETKSLGLKMTDEEIEKIIKLLQNSLTEKKEEKAPEKKEKQEEREIRENPFSPVVNKLIKEWKIIPEEWLEIKKALKWKKLEKKEREEGKKEEYIENFFADTFQNIKLPKEKKQEIIKTLSFLEKTGTKEKNKQNFENHFWANLLPKNAKNFEKDSIVEKTYKILWGNYFIAPENLENGSEQKKSLDLAFEKSLNEIIDGKQIERNESFELSMKIINNPDKSLKERFEALNSINEEVNKQEGVKSIIWSTLKKWRERAKESIDYQKLYAEAIKLIEKLDNKLTKKEEKEKFEELKKEVEDKKVPVSFEKLKEINTELRNLDKQGENPTK